MFISTLQLPNAFLNWPIWKWIKHRKVGIFMTKGHKIKVTFRWLLAVLELLSDIGADWFFLRGLCLFKVSSMEFFLAFRFNIEVVLEVARDMLPPNLILVLEFYSLANLQQNLLKRSCLYSHGHSLTYGY